MTAKKRYGNTQNLQRQTKTNSSLLPTFLMRGGGTKTKSRAEKHFTPTHTPSLTLAAKIK